MCTTFEAHTNGHFIFTALSIILKQHPPSELMKHTDINLTVQGLLPYTGEQLIVSIYVYEILLIIERHFQRLSRLQQVCINQYAVPVRMCNKLITYVTRSTNIIRIGTHSETRFSSTFNSSTHKLTIEGSITATNSVLCVSSLVYVKHWGECFA